MDQSNFLVSLSYSHLKHFFRLFTSFLLIIFLIGCASNNDTAWDLNSTKIEQIYNKWRGTPYRLGGTNKKGVDCSGFVHTIFKDEFNITLPRNTTEQAKIGVKVSKKDLQSGDLVLFRLKNSANNLHVGIYHKNGQFIHASTSKGVMVSSLDESYWKDHYWQARRI